MRLLIDAHEDLGWNMLTFGRDYTRPALWTRAQEAGTSIPANNGDTLLGQSEWLLGHVGVIFATLFVSPERRRLGEWDVQCYRDSGEAAEKAGHQLDAYHRLVDVNEVFRFIGTQADLEEVLGTWEDGRTLPDRRIGIVPLMEGADPVLEPQQIEEWFERGVRIVGLSWEATRYAGGTHEPGGLTPEGIELLEQMADLNMLLDLSHLAEESYWDAIDRYPGVAIVSHANPRRFLPTTRGLSDDMIRALAERDGVMGIVPFNRFLDSDWHAGDPKAKVPLLTLVDVIDHICQVTGSAAHVGIGTDFDGGFGMQHTPQGIDTIDDLWKLQGPLLERGFSDEQIAGIFAGNWLRMLRRGLPGDISIAG